MSTPTKEEVENAVAYLRAVKGRIKGAENAEYAISTVLSALEAAQKDSARIDWLDDNTTYIGGGTGGVYSFKTPADVETGMLRAAIDAASTP